MGFTKILAAVDGSPLGQSVFQQAVDLAQLYQASLILFHCLAADKTVAPPTFSGELGLSPGIISQAYQAQQMYLEQQVRQMKALMTHYGQLAHQQGVKTEFDYSGADAGTGICQAAKRWGTDLIVMGRRGRKGLTEALLGSVSNYVLHHAGCAVLVVQADGVAGNDGLAQWESEMSAMERG